jgi:hypothetical protein
MNLAAALLGFFVFRPIINARLKSAKELMKNQTENQTLLAASRRYKCTRAVQFIHRLSKGVPPGPKMSTKRLRLALHDETVGELLKVPCNQSQSVGDGCHAEPFQHLWYIELSVPRRRCRVG